MDEILLRQVRQNLQNATNRGIVGLLGMPMDTVNQGLGLLGMAQPRPMLGSDWMADKMLQAGLLTSPERFPFVENSLMALSGPMGMRMPTFK